MELLSYPSSVCILCYFYCCFLRCPVWHALFYSVILMQGEIIYDIKTRKMIKDEKIYDIKTRKKINLGG